MAFDALTCSLDLVRTLAPIVRIIGSHDGKLADQVRRAASGIGLTLAEGAERRGRDRLHLFRTALGSAAEVRTALAIAVAWGYLTPADTADADAMLDRIRAMTWRLAR